MIGKLKTLTHSAINSVFDKESGKQSGNHDKKDQGQKHSSDSQKQNDSAGEKHYFLTDKEPVFNLQEVVDTLNNNEYYQSKGMIFSVSTGDDGNLVTVKNLEEQIIQKLSPTQAFLLSKKLQTHKDQTDQIKGGILNIKG